MTHTPEPQKKTSTELALEGLKIKFWRKKPSIFEDGYCSVYSPGYWSNNLNRTVF